MRLGKQLSDQASDPLIDRVINQAIDQPTKWLTEWLSNSMSDWPTVTYQLRDRATKSATNRDRPTVIPTRLLFSEEYPFNWPCSHHSPHWEEHRNYGRLKNNDERRIGWMRTWLNGTDNLVEWGTLFRGKAKVWFCYDSWERSTTFLGVRSVLEVNCVVW